MNLRPLYLTLFLAHIGHGNAQFIGSGGEIPSSNPTYTFSEAIQNGSLLEDRLNQQGALGIRIRTFTSFSSTVTIPPPNSNFPPTTSTTTERSLVFIDDQKAGDETFSYQVLPQPNSFNENLAQLNSQGANGFSYIDSQTIGSNILNLYSRNDQLPKNTEYFFQPLFNSPSAFADSATDLGSQGWEYLTRLTFRSSPPTDPFGQFTTVSIFRREPGTSETFEVVTDNRSFDPNTLQTALNSRGDDGFRFVHSVLFGNAERTIFSRNINRDQEYAYQFQTQVTSAGGLVQQANLVGEIGSYFKEIIFFGATEDASQDAPLYATLTENFALADTASLALSADGLITFTPSAVGRFRLEASPNLQVWIEEQDPQDTTGQPLFWNIGFDRSKEFFRIVPSQ